MWVGYALAAALGLSSAAQAVLHHQYYARATRLSTNARSAVTALLYRHCLTLSSSAFAKTTVGEAVNLVAVHAGRFDEFFMNGNHLHNAPLEAIVGLVLLYREVGVASLVGFVVFAMLAPMQFVFTRLFLRLRKQSSNFAEARVRSMASHFISYSAVR